MALSAPVRAGTVSGFVYGGDNGEGLAFTHVQVKGESRGTLSDEHGRYTLAGLPPGQHTLVFRRIGYQAVERVVDLTVESSLSLSLELPPDQLTLDAMVVEGQSLATRPEPGKVTLRTRDVLRHPGIAEADLFRSLQALPGVNTLSDFSSGLYIRGGSPDQNLILLDGLDVYNPNHLFGFFSTFNVDAVKTVELQKSGYPARYGGRLSSLLDVHNRDGNRKEVEGTARIGLIASSLTLEGPWSRGSWMVSGRQTYIEQLARSARYRVPYGFHDLHGRLNLDLAGDDRFSLSYYQGRDRLDWDRPALDLLVDWGNSTWSGRWTHVFSPRWYARFLVGHTSFDSRAEFSFRDLKFAMSNRIEDLCFRGDLSFVPGPGHRLELGHELKALDFHFDRRTEEEYLRFDYDGTYGGLYLQDTWTPSRPWEIQGGLRADYYSGGRYFRAGPRLRVRREVNAITSASLSYGVYHQFLNLVSPEGSTGASDWWFPVDRTVKPGRADHYVAGLEIRPRQEYNLVCEAYYKPYHNVVEFSEEYTRSVIEPDAELDELFNSGRGRAYGVEVYLRNEWAGFSGWVGYTWGVTRRRIHGYNSDKEFTPTHDRKHQFVMTQEHGLGRGWRGEVSLRYGTGQPVTLATARYLVRDITGREYHTVLDGEKNAYRLPGYFRLDLSIQKRWKFRGWELEPSIQAINVLDHDNVYLRLYDLEENPAKYHDITMLPFVPSITLNVFF